MFGSVSFVRFFNNNSTSNSNLYIYIYKTLWHVSVQGSAVSGLQERSRTYKHKICHATCYTIPSIVGGISQSRYQVLLLSCNMFVRSHFRLHYTHINRLYMIPSIVGGILQSVLNLIQCVKVLSHPRWSSG
jgi:hypothetical protein